ncbi:MAG TPA: patatin-like phospholipase family protein [Mycobacteriales bacterium]|nr:patatin-like phospholipase family protein [Mycobacteriales bacterium]
MSLLPFRAPRGRAASAPRPVAVVLSGGGSAGAAQAGMLSALFDAGVRPDFLVGCSVGALNAAVVAVDPSPERVAELAVLWRRLTAREVFGSGSVRRMLNLVRRRDHLCAPDALRRLVREWVPITDLSETAIPVHVITTDLHTGRAAWWSAGDAQSILTASACLPGVFPPVALGDSRHVDGGVSDGVPIDRAVELGAATVWVLDVTSDDPLPHERRLSALDVLLRSFTISRASRRADGELVERGITVHHIRVPATAGLDPRDFSRSAELVDAGYAATKAFVEALSAPPPTEREQRARRLPRLRRAPAA